MTRPVSVSGTTVIMGDGLFGWDPLAPGLISVSYMYGRYTFLRQVPSAMPFSWIFEAGPVRSVLTKVSDNAFSLVATKGGIGLGFTSFARQPAP